MKFNLSILFSLLLLGSSCANLEKSDVKKNQTEISSSDASFQDEYEDDESEEEKLVQEAREELEDVDYDGKLIGSAKIENPHQYNGKSYFLYGAEHLKLDNYYFDIPVVYNPAVKKWIKYFQTRGKKFFVRYGARAGRYAPVMSKVLADNGLPRDLIFLAMAESGFQTEAKSWAKAVGAWQFMPFTGKKFGLRIDWYLDERRDPIKSTQAASKYLKFLYDKFGSWELAMASYNAGEGKIGRAIRRYRTESFWKIRRGRYLKSETKNYVPKIMALAIIGKNLKAFGFEDLDYHKALAFEEVEVPAMTDLYTVSNGMGIDFKEIKKYNPEVRRWFTPPGQTYKLRVPAGKKVAFENCCSNLDSLKATAFKTYRVRGKKSTLRDVSRKFKIKGNVLTTLNGVGARKKLKRNQNVLLPFREGQSNRHRMYADLYERPRKSVIRRRRYRSQIRKALKYGKKITNPSRYYTVRRGDTLWDVARKNNVSLNTLIASNYGLIKRRMIRAGDRLVVD